MERVGDNFPEEITERMVFIEGGAFLKKKHQFKNELPKARLFFILNRNPKVDDTIITVHATTQIASRKKCRQPDVLVEICPKDYDEIRENSIVDCQSYIIWRKFTLKAEIKLGNIRILKVIPNDLLNRLRKAIGFSRTLAPIDKRLIFPEE